MSTLVRKIGFITSLALAIMAYIQFRQNEAFQPKFQKPPTARFIVQGNDMQELKRLVNQVGGSLTHELDIIHAVGASLTSEQVEQLKAHQKVHHITEDRTLTTATLSDGGAFGNNYIDFEGNTLDWGVTNTNSHPLTIKKISISWPRANGNLQTISFGSQSTEVNVRKPPFTTWTDPNFPWSIPSNSSEHFTFEFDFPVSAISDKYKIKIKFTDGSKIKFILNPDIIAVDFQDTNFFQTPRQ